MPKVSVIIPCYNYGKTILETLESVYRQTYQDFEIIIVNDGSTDEYTNTLLSSINNSKVTLINKQNEGLAKARNTGIENSKGEYILPLDSDDKIDPAFIEKTLSTIEKDNKIGVVYTDQYYFGIENKYIEMQEFDFVHELLRNHVSVCSLIRKNAFKKVKDVNKFGYNPNMEFGYEDWDFWISIYEAGYKIFRIPEPLFFYRRTTTSMINRTVTKHRELIQQLMLNHKESYKKHHAEVILQLQDLYMDKIKYSKQLENDSSNILWLLKRLILALTNKIKLP